jgi:hypothetical protein
LDDVIGNLDRRLDNLLRTPDGNIIPIDHGLALPQRNGKHGYRKTAFKVGTPLSAESLAGLRELQSERGALSAKMRELGVDQESIAAMFERVDLLLASGSTSKQWRSLFRVKDLSS